MCISTIASLLDGVRVAGQMALEAQRKPGALERNFKEDGSVITQIDGQVEDYLVAKIARRYPDANLVTEEAARPFSESRPYTFCLDPIDGTDVYSQGMAGWCVSLGLLDRDLRPIAGIVYAPRLDLLFFADVGTPATLNGDGIHVPPSVGSLLTSANVMVSSRIYRYLDFCGFRCKIRSIGSGALHLCFPLVYRGVFAAVQGPGSHIWDIAGAHAINASLGSCFEYWDGSQIDYSALLDGSSGRDIIVSGPRPHVEALKCALARVG
jgi:fructose-1,6-bisphosphatase/inositol monophosphatase family enzyme